MEISFVSAVSDDAGGHQLIKSLKEEEFNVDLIPVIGSVDGKASSTGSV